MSYQDLHILGQGRIRSSGGKHSGQNSPRLSRNRPICHNNDQMNIEKEEQIQLMSIVRKLSMFSGFWCLLLP